MLVQPFEDLDGAVTFLALTLQKLLQGRQGQVLEIGKVGIGHREEGGALSTG